ncbi:HCNGP-like protein [Colletotrichum karsti]|uniref:HCNGP-like protein n=1 Tax=Colletotrichum karsti TaxID=1095194 RepID=A0A9P6IAT0_9PEZI|nr:HCNGP-like protein [Colletotrichum karsti]KAF9880002.1 HCNGP-like protein [Colletotrichum karsti]
MAGLVAYASSDDDDEVQDVVPEKTENSKTSTPPVQNTDSNSTKQPSPPPQKHHEAPEPEVTIGPVQQHSVPLGPALPQMEPQGPEGPPSQADDGQPRASPYTASRALLRDLTLPTVPNFDIPPSPPGSPLPALETKFTQFLELKNKGVHFNAKLAQSAALRNPSLTDKLLGFVELDGRAGYATTLPRDIWDPTSEESLPEWASRTALRQSQERVRADRAELRRAGGPVEFVPAAAAAAPAYEVAVPGGNEATEQGGLRPGKRKAGAW